MKPQLRFAWLAITVGLLFCFSGGAYSEDPPKKVTLELKNADVMDALALVAKAGLTYSIQGPIPKDLQVTISLQNADPETALRVICNAAGLDRRSTPDGWVIYAKPSAMYTRPPAPLFPRPQKITKSFINAPVAEAIMDLAEEAATSFAIQGEIPKDLRVTVSLRDADPREALLLLARAAGLDIKEEPGGLLISVPPTVSVGGARVPIVGAAPAVSGRNIVLRKDEQGRIVDIEVDGGAIALPGGRPGAALAGTPALASQSRTSFKGDKNLVDLDVKDARMRDAMAQLSKASGVPIHVHESVPQDIKVTARLYKMPLGEVLSAVTEQANLTCAVERTKDPVAKKKLEEGLITQAEYEASEGPPRIHIVPKPELKVSGPGIRPGEYPTYPPPGVLSGQQAQQLPEKVFGHCPKCHANLLSREWKFCPRCGAKLPAPAKQKAEPKSTAR